MKLADGIEITWAQNDARYIEQGKLMMPRMDPEGVREETRRMNEKKNGRPFKYPDSVFVSLAVIQCLSGLSYRKLQGMMYNMLGGAIHYTCIRRRILNLKPDMHIRSRPGDRKLIIDGTGLEPRMRGEFIRAKHAVRRGFIRLNIIIDHDTMEILAFDVTDERTGETRRFGANLEDAIRAIRAVQDADGADVQDVPDAGNADAEDGPKIKLLGDGIYSSSDIHSKCASLGVELISPVKINSVARANGCQRRKAAVLEQLGDLHDSGNASVSEFADMTDGDRRRNRKKWKKRVGYGRRWLVEIAFSSFKRTFGSSVRARTMENIIKEVMFKVCTYNRMLWIARDAMFA